jgi:hypothetical protein
MAKRLQHRGGTTAQHSTFTGAVREVTVDTDKNTLVVHDGATAGGKPLPTLTGTETLSNKTLASPIFSGDVGINISSPNLNSFQKAVTLSGTTNCGYELAKGSTLHGAFALQGDNRVQVINFQNADLTFNTGTGATERMRIDHSTGRIGIGTSAPTEELTVSGANAHIDITNSSNSSVALIGGSGSTGDAPNRGYLRLRKDGSANDGITLNTNGNSWINNGGNLGIGTITPDGKLDIASPQTTSNKFTSPNLALTATVQDNNEGFTGISYASATIANYGWTVGATRWTGGTGDSHFTFRNHVGSASGNERVRIDKAGNLLVGKTSANTSTGGAELRTDGLGSFTRSGTYSITATRTTNDGDIISIRKDGTVIGAIGVSNSDNLYVDGVVSGHGGISFGSTSWVPRSGGAFADNAVDIGNNGNFIKDIYVKGGIYFGTNTSANKLDDYEEGTWTPTLTGGTITHSAQAGIYLKVGSLVTLWWICDADLSSASGNLDMTGIPFTAQDIGDHNTRYSGTISYQNNTGLGSGSLYVQTSDGSTISYYYGQGNRYTGNTSGNSNFQIRGALTYRTAS